MPRATRPARGCVWGLRSYRKSGAISKGMTDGGSARVRFREIGAALPEARSPPSICRPELHRRALPRLGDRLRVADLSPAAQLFIERASWSTPRRLRTCPQPRLEAEDLLVIQTDWPR